MDDLMTVKEVAAVTRLAPSSIYGLVSQKSIPHFKLGARVVFSRGEITRWIEEKRQPVQSVGRV